jgi:hypothetical protein
MPRAKAKRVVAELGRPETPEEEAARRAENSRLYRQRKTVNNLVYSLIVTLGVVAIIYFAVPRTDGPVAWEVDYVSVGEQAQESLTQQIVIPALSDEWKANAAEIRTGSDGIQTWRIGLVTPMQGYISFEQAFGANPTWISNRMNGTIAVATVNIDGVTWDVFDNGNEGNNSYALATTRDGVTYLLRGDAGESEFAQLASAVTTSINSLASP